MEVARASISPELGNPKKTCLKRLATGRGRKPNKKGRGRTDDHRIYFLGQSVDFHPSRDEIRGLRGLHQVSLGDVVMGEVIGNPLGCFLAAQSSLDGLAQPGIEVRTVFGGAWERREVC
jgi:hypothetical protein